LSNLQDFSLIQGFSHIIRISGVLMMKILNKCILSILVYIENIRSLSLYTSVY